MLITALNFDIFFPMKNINKFFYLNSLPKWLKYIFFKHIDYKTNPILTSLFIIEITLTTICIKLKIFTHLRLIIFLIILF